MLLRNLSLFAAICAVSVANISTANAVPNNFENHDRIVAQDRRDRHKGDRRSRIIERLNLNENQKSQIARIKEQYQQRYARLREQVRSQRRELESMLGSASNSQLRAKHRELTRLRQELDNFRFENTLEWLNVMTSEQRQEFARLMQERQERYNRRMGDRRRGDREGKKGQLKQ